MGRIAVWVGGPWDGQEIELPDPAPITLPFIDTSNPPSLPPKEALVPEVPLEWEPWTVPIRKWSDGTYRLFWWERTRHA